MPIERPETSAHRYLALDALRGAAAFAVLFYHLRGLDAPGRPEGYPSTFASGYLAVDLFFLLSGFVISHAYGERLLTGLTFRHFMTARFVRLQPVIAFATFIGFALAVSQRLMAVQMAPGYFSIVTSLPANLLMLPNILVPWGIFLFNPPAWSLFYELVANAIYALAIKRANTADNETGAWSSVDLGLAVTCATGLVGLMISVARFGNLDKGVVLDDAPVALARIAFSFTLGLLIHRKRYLWIPRLRRIPMPWLLAACIALLAPGFDGTSRALYDLAFVIVISPALVMLTAVTQPSPRLAASAAWLGMISYPLYAVHAPIKHLLEAALPITFLPLLIISSFTAVLVAWLLGASIDPALRRWLAGRLQAQKPDASATVPAPVQLQRGT